MVSATKDRPVDRPFIFLGSGPTTTGPYDDVFIDYFGPFDEAIIDYLGSLDDVTISRKPHPAEVIID